MRTFYFVAVGWELAGLLGGSHFCSAQEWTATSAPVTNWSSVASSADGSKLVAAVNGGLIYTSTNSGSTWVATSAPANSWGCVASSADGTRLFAVGLGLYASADSGSTWQRTGGGVTVSLARPMARRWPQRTAISGPFRLTRGPPGCPLMAEDR